MQAIGETVVFLLSDHALTKIVGVTYDMGVSLCLHVISSYNGIEARIFLAEASNNSLGI
jgi:hypothetical protein